MRSPRACRSLWNGSILQEPALHVWPENHVLPKANCVRVSGVLLKPNAADGPTDPTSAHVREIDFASGLGDVAPDATTGWVDRVDNDAVRDDSWRSTQAAVNTLRRRGLRIMPVALPLPVQATRSILALFYTEGATYQGP